MLWLKAFHIIGVVSWFAGLLYLPRLFVYHSQIQNGVIDDQRGNARFKIMARKLFMIMTIGALLAAGFGVAMLALAPDYLLMRWLHLKLTLFIVIGAISIFPTITYLRWRKTLRASGTLPAEAEVRKTRKLVMIQAHLLVLIPLAAVFLARGFGK